MTNRVKLNMSNNFQMSLDSALSTLHHQWTLFQDQELIRPGGSLDQVRIALRYEDKGFIAYVYICLLYTSDAADE